MEGAGVGAGVGAGDGAGAGAGAGEGVWPPPVGFEGDPSDPPHAANIIIVPSAQNVVLESTVPPD